MDIAGSMNITFKADISAQVATRPSVLYWVIQPGSNVGGIGAGLVRMVRPWNEWLIVWGYDISQPPPEVDAEKATEIVRNLLGMPDLDVEITGTSLWGNNEMYATHLQRQRVFAAGDAVHRHPPSNGLGSNTSVQDSYNLAWKLAAVLRGQAGPGLLETYSQRARPGREADRDPGQQVEPRVRPVLRGARPDRGGDRGGDAGSRSRSARPTPPRGRAKREALVSAMELKNYEFNAHGVELGQFYESSRDRRRRQRPGPSPPGTPSCTTRPPPSPARTCRTSGSATPRSKVSTLDLAPYGTFTLITGIAGEAWADGRREGRPTTSTSRSRP